MPLESYDECIELQIFLDNAMVILQMADEEGVFKCNPNLLHEGCMYASFETYQKKGTPAVVLKVIKKLLEWSHFHALQRITGLLTKHNTLLNDLDNHILQTVYKELIYKTQTNTSSSSHEKFSIFFVIKTTLMSNECISFLDGTDHKFETCRTICSDLFDAGFSLTNNPETDSDLKQCNLIIWLVELLNHSLLYGAFHQSKGHAMYYQLVEKIMNLPFQIIGDQTEFQQSIILENTFKLLCGLEDRETTIGKKLNGIGCQPYSKAIKAKRSQLLLRWLFELAQMPEEKYSTTAEDFLQKAQVQNFLDKSGCTTLEGVFKQ